MEPKPAALLVVGELTAADLVMSVVAVALGAFAAVSPRRAAEIWESERLRTMTSERQALFVRWWLTFGIFLFAGVCSSRTAWRSHDISARRGIDTVALFRALGGGSWRGRDSKIPDAMLSCGFVGKPVVRMPLEGKSYQLAPGAHACFAEELLQCSLH
jgi:hypothetical protein